MIPEAAMTKNIEKNWGVKCLTDIGWHGAKKPAVFTRDEAEQVAARLNNDPKDLDTWGAQLLAGKPGRRRL